MNLYRVEFTDGTWTAYEADSLGSLYSKMRKDEHLKMVDKIFKKEVTYSLQWKKSDK